MSVYEIIDRFKTLLKESSDAQLALNRFKNDMGYAAPECQDYRFWSGTAWSPGICTILSKYARNNSAAYKYFQRVVDHYNETKTLKDV